MSSRGNPADGHVASGTVFHPAPIPVSRDLRRIHPGGSIRDARGGFLKMATGRTLGDDGRFEVWTRRVLPYTQ